MSEAVLVRSKLCDLVRDRVHTYAGMCQRFELGCRACSTEILGGWRVGVSCREWLAKSPRVSAVLRLQELTGKDELWIWSFAHTRRCDAKVSSTRNVNDMYLLQIEVRSRPETAPIGTTHADSAVMLCIAAVGLTARADVHLLVSFFFVATPQNGWLWDGRGSYRSSAPHRGTYHKRSCGPL